MGKPRCCNYCGQALPEVRLGVRLTELKARIFDLVQRGGRDGITSADLRAILSDESEMAPRTLISHVSQVNDLIEGSGYAIRGSGGTGSVYRLVQKTTR